MKDFPAGIIFLRNFRVRAAFDDLLSSLVASGGPEVIKEFQKCGAIQVFQTSEGIKYSNQEYTRVGYPILGYFRVQVPENL